MINYDFHLYDFKDKKKALFTLISQMYKITLNMFKWEGLPSTIPARELEKLLQMRGSCIIAQHEGNLYALGGNLGGDCDAYYIPKDYIDYETIKNKLKINFFIIYHDPDSFVIFYLNRDFLKFA